MQKIAKKVPKNAHCRILFTDEEIFNTKEKFSRHNDCVFAKSCYEVKDEIPKVQRGHPPLSVICLVGSFILWCNLVYFCDSDIYLTMLNDVVSPPEETVFMDEDE